MFGDLFEDGVPRQRTRPRWRGSQTISTRRAPPSPRPGHGFCGLANQGATCYLNCLLQTLYMTPEFRSGLFSLTDEELGSDPESQKNGKKARVIPIQLRRLFARLSLLDQSETMTTELTDSFGWTSNEELQQHDVQELNRILFNAIEESLYGTGGQELIKDLYHGTVVNKIVCQECGHSSEREEDFLDLCVTVSGNLGLENSLHQYYNETERLDGKNQYRCEKCVKLVNAVRSARVRRLPCVLTVSLLRFSFDFVKMERYKETGRFSFPMVLDMSQYCEEETGACQQYELYSVIIHRGSAHGGHYHAYIRDLSAFGDWSEPEDVVVPSKKRTDDFDVLDLETPQNVLESVLLRLRSASLDQICSEIVKETGVSWNKRYKSKHGPISKFVKRFEDKFCLVDGMVTLKDGGYANGTAHDQATSRVSHWFDFNDGTVRPIRTSEIQTQFSGRESGYMLIYRRFGSEIPFSHEPQDLFSEIMEFNRSLEKERVEYDRAQNETTFTLLRTQDLDLTNGTIKISANLQHSDRDSLKIVLDKRKESRLLHEEVRLRLEGSEPEKSVKIHVAKSLPAGIHLYTEIPDSDQRLNEFITEEEVQTLVWNGVDINGLEYPCGREHEPLVLALDLGKSSTQMPFFKSSTLGSVLTKLELEGDCSVRVIKGDSSNDQAVLLPVEDLKKTLSDLALEDYDQLVVTGHGFACRPGMISLTVENRLVADDDQRLVADDDQRPVSDDVAYPESVLEVELDLTIEGLRDEILRHLSLNDETTTRSCRLRVEDDFCGLQAPLRLEASLKSQNFKSGTRIVLELGPVPRQSQIPLTFKMADPSVRFVARQSVELNVERSWPVRKCTLEAMTSLGLEEGDWHLRTTTWCGEAATVLDDPETEVGKLGLKDGDTVLVQQGRALPSGYLRPSIWLYPTLTTEDGCRQAWVRHQEGDNLARGDCPRPEYCGEVEVSKTTTTTELKQVALTLPQLLSHVIPSTDFLRVRKVDDQGYQTSILRDKCRQKVASDGVLVVQVLTEEEKLSPSEIIVNVQLHSSDAAFTPTELCVNLDSVNTIRKFTQIVSDHLGLEAQHCIMAKHTREKFEWLVIRENKFNANKKKTPVKVNFRGNPYFLKDGDLIAVKNLLKPQKGIPDDFTTEEDRKGREGLRQEAEEKRRRRRERKNSSSSGLPDWVDTKLGTERKEHSLNIHVENFRVT